MSRSDSTTVFSATAHDLGLRLEQSRTPHDSPKMGASLAQSASVRLNKIQAAIPDPPGKQDGLEPGVTTGKKPGLNNLPE